VVLRAKRCVATLFVFRMPARVVQPVPRIADPVSVVMAADQAPAEVQALLGWLEVQPVRQELLEPQALPGWEPKADKVELPKADRPAQQQAASVVPLVSLIANRVWNRSALVSWKSAKMICSARAVRRISQSVLGTLFSSRCTSVCATIRVAKPARLNAQG
jgi:hypothetical protein